MPPGPPGTPREGPRHPPEKFENFLVKTYFLIASFCSPVERNSPSAGAVIPIPAPLPPSGGAIATRRAQEYDGYPRLEYMPNCILSMGGWVEYDGVAKLP